MNEKIKVGDWLRNKHTNEIFKNEFVEKINGCLVVGTIKKDNPNKGCKTIYYIHNDIVDIVELWKPKVGEWCWFWNLNSTIPVFGIFCDNVKGLSRANIDGSCCVPFDFCKPFVGELPFPL